MSKNLESFREILDSLCFTFSAIFLSETWCQSHKTSNSNLQIPDYVSLQQTWKNRRGGGLCIFLLESFSCKVRDDLAVNSSSIECLCVEVFNKNSKSIVLNLTYRPPNGDLNDLENHFKNIISKWEVTNNELISMPFPEDTARKLNVHKTFRRRPGRLLNVLCTFNLRLCLLG